MLLRNGIVLPMYLPKRGRPIAKRRERKETIQCYRAVLILRKDRKLNVWRVSDDKHKVGRDIITTEALIKMARRHRPNKPPSLKPASKEALRGQSSERQQQEQIRLL